MGNMNLTVRTYAFGIYNTRPAFMASGERALNWQMAQATLKFTSSFQIVFEAIGNSDAEENSQIWLDDIEISYKPCQPVATCDFEDGICGFNHNLNSDFNWLLINGEYGLN